MANATEVLTIRCSEDVATAIKSEIDSHQDSKSEFSERRNLDGSTAAWIVIASLAVQSLSPILTYLGKFLESKAVKKIKVGDIEIDNPTPEDVARLRALIDARIQAEKKDG
jgi:hypothetical protein